MPWREYLIDLALIFFNFLCISGCALTFYLFIVIKRIQDQTEVVAALAVEKLTETSSFFSQGALGIAGVALSGILNRRKKGVRGFLKDIL